MISSPTTEPLSILFFGTPLFSQLILATLLEMPSVKVRGVVTQPDRPAGRGKQLTQSPVKNLAQENALPILQPHSIKKELPAFLEAASQYGPIDLAVVVAYGQILPRAVLDLPKICSVNIHASLLPRWRGAAPIQRAIMAGDSETGICLMKMDIGMDTGPVFSTRKIPIEPGDTAASLHDRLALLAAAQIRDDLGKIASGALTATAQAEVGITHAAKISAEEACINWQGDAQSIERNIRGLCPAPGAFTMLGGKRLKIFEAAIVDLTVAKKEPPGTLVTTDDKKLLVYCGDRLLSLEQVQLEGNKRLSAREFLHGMGQKLPSHLNS